MASRPSLHPANPTTAVERGSRIKQTEPTLLLVGGVPTVETKISITLK